MTPLAALVTALVELLTIVGTVDVAQAQASCFPAPPGSIPAATQVCETGVDSSTMDPAYRRQRTSVWCWAASMEMVLRFSGHDIPQKTIVNSVFGKVVPTALPYDAHLRNYLNRTYSHGGDRATISSLQLYPSADPLNSIIAALNSDHPLLLMTPTHVVVLTGLYYYTDAAGTPIATYAAIVRDPFPYAAAGHPTPGISIPGHPGERVMAANEFQTQRFVFKVNVADVAAPATSAADSPPDAAATPSAADDSPAPYRAAGDADDIARAIKELVQVQDYNSLSSDPAWSKFQNVVIAADLQDYGGTTPDHVAVVATVVVGTDANLVHKHLGHIVDSLRVHLPLWRFKDEDAPNQIDGYGFGDVDFMNFAGTAVLTLGTAKSGGLWKITLRAEKSGTPGFYIKTF